MKSITRFTKNIHGNRCLNCEAQISEENNFCPNCGQVNDEKRLSVGQYFSEYLAGFYSFDNRFLKTVIPLIFKPGKVTREYVSGKRIRYVNPFQLYLHITILFFLMIGTFNTIDSFRPDGLKTSDTLSELSSQGAVLNFDTIKNNTIREAKKQNIGVDSIQLNEFKTSLDEAGKIIQSAIKEPDSSDLRYVRVISYTDSLFQNSVLLHQLKDKKLSGTEKDSLFGLFYQEISREIEQFQSPSGPENKSEQIAADLMLGIEDSSSKFNKAAIDRLEILFHENEIEYQIPYKFRNPSVFEKRNSGIGRAILKVEIFMDYDKEYPESSANEALEAIGFEKSYQNIYLYSKSRELNKALSDPEVRKDYFDRIISKISVAVFFLLPVFTLVVALLYIRNRNNYTEHLIFVFHVQTAFFLLLMLFMLIDRIFNANSVEYVFFILFLIYLYKAMRNFYKQNRIKTIIKFIILNHTFMVLAFIGGLIISFIAFFL